MDNLFKKLEENQVHVSLVNGELKVKFNGDQLSDDLLQEIKASKQALITYLQQVNDLQGEHVQVAKAVQKDYYQMSSAQSRLYFLQEFDPQSTGYNAPMVKSLGTEVDKERLLTAFRQLIERHESLRTSFERVNDVVYQKIHNQLSFSFDEHECTAEDFSEYLKNYVRPFDLNTAPLFRSSLVHVHEIGYVWIVDMHHIISDGTSHQVLMNDFFQLYQGQQLPALKLQYKDFSEWQNNIIENGELESQKQYWLSQFATGIPKLNLAADAQRPPVFTFEGANYCFYIDTAYASKLRDFCSERKGTLQMALISVLKVLLYKYTGQEDLVIGCGIAGRRHADLQGIVGMFVNTLAIRSSPHSHKTFNEFYQEVVDTSLSAYENQDVQFEDLVDSLNVKRDPSRNPIFDISLLVQNFERVDFNGQGNKKNKSQPAVKRNNHTKLDAKTSKFDMTWFVHESGENIFINVEYYSAIYQEKRIARFAKHFQAILKTVLDTPSISISSINPIDIEEEEELLATFVNGPIQDNPIDNTIHALFERQCIATPHNIAIVDEKGSITYNELNMRANKLARFLKEELKLKPESCVAILQPRSKETVISILAILKAGGAYIPLDVDYPIDRIHYMLEDAGVNILLTGKDVIELSNRLQWSSKRLEHLVCVDSDRIYKEFGTKRNELMEKELWDHVGEIATDNISGGGWQSSFTGEYLSELEMEEYSQNTFEKLKDHLNTDLKVLEIGCSSGLTLFKIASHVGKYYGADLSSTILENTAKSLKKHKLSNVTLTCLAAHEIDQIEENDFDLIIINSVIQCFDGHNYLREVVNKATEKLKTRGLIFLGDLMDEDRRVDLINDLSQFKEKNQGKGYITKTDFDTELFVARDFLYDLKSDNTEITAVEASDKIHTVENELTKYRFDALLTIDKNQGEQKGKKIKHQYDLTAIDQYSPTNMNLKANGSDLAYLIYTSGSTGRPKGVLMQHNSLINLIYSLHLNVYSQYEGNLRLALVSPFIFDASTQQTFGSLFYGHSLYIVPDEIRTSGEQLWTYYHQKQIDVSDGTPSHIYLLTNDQSVRKGTVKHFIIGGEAFSINLARQFFEYCEQRECQPVVSNVYGPTEACVNSSLYTFNASSMPTNKLLVPIGRPLPNTGMYILDEQSRSVPVGMAGEVYIGGVQVGRGYLKNPEQTTHRFVKSPFGEGRLYRTGDLARWDSDGNIEYIGRVDDQVKIRGFRIELGEIENVIRSHPFIDSTVVITKENKNEELELVAYVVSKEILDVSEIRAYLIKTLPDYMLPNHFVILDKLPIAATGKIERKKLPNPEGLSLNNNNFVAAKNEVQKALVSIWQELLGKDNIGIEDDFFNLGGHSLLAMRVIAMTNRKLDTQLKIKNLFVNPTIKALSEYLANAPEHDQTQNTPINLEKESHVDISLDQIASLTKYSETQQNIFITGTTGFVGAYLLKELLDNTEAVIHCLVRASDVNKGKQRIIDKLKYFDIYDASYDNRIEPILGDISKPRLGISETSYTYLADNVDNIYHIAAHMDFMSTYEQLEPYNVGSTRELIKLASTKKLKKIIYASTIAIFANQREMRYESDNVAEERHSYASGYAGTKWVAERIINKALEKGIPVQIFRLGLISGDSKTGRMPTEQWFPKLLKSCYQMGAYIDQYSIVAMTPVDYVARAILKISLAKKIDSNIFHLSNEKNTPLERVIENVDESIGKEISKITVEDWLRKLKEASEDGPLPITPMVDFDSQGIIDALDGKVKLTMTPRSNVSSLKTQEILEEMGVTFPDESVYVDKYLKSAL